MKNIDKFRDEIDELMSYKKEIFVDKHTGEPSECFGRCDNCKFNGFNCEGKALTWLFEDYVDPCPYAKEINALLMIRDTTGFANDWTEDAYNTAYNALTTAINHLKNVQCMPSWGVIDIINNFCAGIAVTVYKYDPSVSSNIKDNYISCNIIAKEELTEEIMQMTVIDFFYNRNGLHILVNEDKTVL